MRAAPTREGRGKCRLQHAPPAARRGHDGAHALGRGIPSAPRDLCGALAHRRGRSCRRRRGAVFAPPLGIGVRSIGRLAVSGVYPLAVLILLHYLYADELLAGPPHQQRGVQMKFGVILTFWRTHLNSYMCLYPPTGSSRSVPSILPKLKCAEWERTSWCRCYQ